METQKDRAVGIIPVHQSGGGEFLFCIVRHADGHWGFPKGHQDDSESDEEAARRELYEETGITEVKIVPNKSFTEQYAFERDGIHYEKTVGYYVGLVRSTEKTTPSDFKNEIPEMRWLSYAEAEKTLTFPEAKKLLDEVRQYLELWS